MKNVLQLVFVLLLAMQLQAQEKNVVTKSVTIENVIPFVVENYTGTTSKHNITLLVETTKRRLSIEEITLLKQAIKYLSEQLSEDDDISIIAYNKLNGIVLEQTAAKNIKTLLNVINNFSSKVDSSSRDGITLAYNYVEEVYKEAAENTIVMIRNPNGSRVVTSQDISPDAIDEKAHKKQKNGMILLTAIAVLPELIAIIKD